MSQLDAQREAREALGTAVASYGRRVLSDPHTLGNLVADLLPDLPRERSLLVTGAEAGIAAEMRQHVEEQHIDPDTAVQLVARALSDQRAIDPVAGLWVASEYAQALGYQVRPYTAAVPTGPSPRVSPGGPAPQRPPGQFWQPPQPPSQPLPSPWGAASPAPQSWPPAGQPPQSWPPAGGAPQSWPPGGAASGHSWPSPQPSSVGAKSSGSGRRRGLIAAGTAVVLIGGYLIAAATVAHTFPFAKARPVAASSPVHPARPAPKPTQRATTSPTPTPTGPQLAAGVAPLVELLPGDIDDPATQCQNDPPPYGFDMPGRVQALVCTDPGLPKGSQVFAYQLDSPADFEATWQSYNKLLGFTGADLSPTCPPASGQAGTTPMHAQFFPPRAGQLLECKMVSAGNSPPQPVYIWTLPSEDAFIAAVGPPNSSFAPLKAWFASSSMPLTAPSPAAS
jgi:hypothetical protein